MQTAPSKFLNLIFKLLFKYLDEFLVFWIDNLLIYGQTEEEHLGHLELVFCEEFREASIKLKCQNMNISRKKLEYLGHIVSCQGIYPMKQKIKAITDWPPQQTLLKPNI